MSDPARSPSAIVSSIESKNALSKVNAGGLGLRLKQIEKYLATMPGRAEASAYGIHPDANEYNELGLELALRREGQQWALCYSSFRPGDDDESSAPYRPLEEAPLKIKIAAVRLIPGLLQAIENSQDKLAKEIADASALYDETIAKVLNLPPVPKIPLAAAKIVPPATGTKAGKTNAELEGK